MALQLVEFLSHDNLRLPGLLYEPQKKKTVLLYLHGNGSASVFYSVQKMNTLAAALNTRGIAFFPFNNRGAHYIHKLTHETGGKEEDIKMGTAYELIRDCEADIEGALDFLAAKGYTTFYLAGSSTGANKIVTYHYHHRKNRVAGYILLSGGDDTGLYYQMLGNEKFRTLLRKSREETNRGGGRELASAYLGGGLISYQSLFDTINPDGDYNVFPFNEKINNLSLSEKPLFREFRTLDKPTLVVYGGQDEYCYGDVPRCVEILKGECGHPEMTRFEIIKGADHGFHGKEQELASVINSWIPNGIR